MLRSKFFQETKPLRATYRHLISESAETNNNLKQNNTDVPLTRRSLSFDSSEITQGDELLMLKWNRSINSSAAHSKLQ